MKRTNKHYFRDILEYAKFASEFASNISYEMFEGDRKTTFAIVRALEVIGESSNRVPDELKEKYSYLPWHEIRGLRNKIVHNYDDIDYTIVWNIVKNDIPLLISQIELIIDEIE
jgi:uncharacterized protein with HEPN domain